jgi:threonyl-tRNA synthetase
VRQFSQDDCHIYLREDQIASEVNSSWTSSSRTTTPSASPRGSSSPRAPSSAIGSDELWDRAEARCAPRSRATGRPYEMKEGDGAFYGPKIDFDVTDSIGRAWQLGYHPARLQRPGTLRPELHGRGQHRAPTGGDPSRGVGSFERFIAILIEHFAGAFPVWLAPEQVRVLPISDEVLGYAREVTAKLRAAGIRAVCDDRSDTLNYRIRDGEIMKVPYMAVLGKREAEAGQVAIRVRGAGKKQEVVSVEAFTARLVDEIKTRALTPASTGAEA